jgi:hypothetical protein
VETWSLSGVCPLSLDTADRPNGCHIKYISDETHPGTHEMYLIKGPHAEAPRHLCGGEERSSAP